VDMFHGCLDSKADPRFDIVPGALRLLEIAFTSPLHISLCYLPRYRAEDMRLSGLSERCGRVQLSSRDRLGTCLMVLSQGMHDTRTVF